jgi:hypothetical protein
MVMNERKKAIHTYRVFNFPPTYEILVAYEVDVIKLARF